MSLLVLMCVECLLCEKKTRKLLTWYSAWVWIISSIYLLSRFIHIVRYVLGKKKNNNKSDKVNT